MLVLTFLLGCVTGSIGYHLYETRIKSAAARPAYRPAPRDIVEEMGRDLNLSADQKEKLQAIVRQSRERYRALSTQFRPQYDVIRNETNQQIRQILNEEQKARFEKTIKEMDERHKGRDRAPRP